MKRVRKRIKRIVPMGDVPLDLRPILRRMDSVFENGESPYSAKRGGSLVGKSLNQVSVEIGIPVHELVRIYVFVRKSQNEQTRRFLYVAGFREILDKMEEDLGSELGRIEHTTRES